MFNPYEDHFLVDSRGNLVRQIKNKATDEIVATYVASCHFCNDENNSPSLV